jgi:hypothetical protein
VPSLEGWLALFFLFFLAAVVIGIVIIFIYLTRK